MDEKLAADPAAQGAQDDHIARVYSHAANSTHSYSEKQRELINNQHPEVFSSATATPDNRSVCSANSTQYKYIQWTTDPSEYCVDQDDLPPSIRKIENPLWWSKTKKNLILFGSCCETWVAAYAASG